MDTLVRIFGKDCSITDASKIILTEHINIKNRKEHIFTAMVKRISTFPRDGICSLGVVGSQYQHQLMILCTYVADFGHADMLAI